MFITLVQYYLMVISLKISGIYDDTNHKCSAVMFTKLPLPFQRLKLQRNIVWQMVFKRNFVVTSDFICCFYSM